MFQYFFLISGQKIHTESTSSGGSSGSCSRYHVKSSKKRKNNLVITLESETDSENSKSRSCKWKRFFFS